MDSSHPGRTCDCADGFLYDPRVQGNVVECPSCGESAASPLDIDALLGTTRFVVPPEIMDNAALVKIAYAAQACLEQWAQGRGAPPRISEERTLRDALGLDMEVFGDARS